MIHRVLSGIKRFTWNMPLTILLGFVLGGLMIPLGQWLGDVVADMYDETFPVVEMTGSLITKNDGEALLAMSGRKNRDCSYIGIRAYAADRDGIFSDVYISRIDNPEGGTRPIGSFIVGTWKVWPLSKNAQRLLIYSSHLCGSRIVLTKVAELSLPTGVQ